MNKKITATKLLIKMHYKNLIVISALALLLSSCSSPAPKQTATSSSSEPATSAAEQAPKTTDIEQQVVAASENAQSAPVAPLTPPTTLTAVAEPKPTIAEKKQQVVTAPEITKPTPVAPPEPPTSLVKVNRSDYPKGMTVLHWAALEESDDAKLERLISQASAAELNQANALGHTPTHYIFASRPWELALLTWERGGKPELETLRQESGWYWRAEFLGDPAWLAIELAVERALQDSNIKLAAAENGEQIFSVSSKAPGTYQNPADGVSIVAQVIGRDWQQQQIQEQQGIWQRQAQKRETNFRLWQADVNRRERELSARLPRVAAPEAIAEVPEPSLPPVQKYQKDVFETVAMFNERLANARADREQQTARIMADYRAKVEQRNARVLAARTEYERKVAARNKELELRQQALALLREEVARKNAELKQEQQAFAQQQQDFYAQLSHLVQERQPYFFAVAYREIYGAPELKPLYVDGQAKYDAETSTLFLEADFASVGIQRELSLEVEPGAPARAFFQSLERGALEAQAIYAISAADGGVYLKDVKVQQGQNTYLAQLESRDRFTAVKPVEVVLASKDELPALSQSELRVDLAAGASSQQLVPIEQIDLSQLELQNPVIKDTEFETYLRTEQQNFNDDVPQLLARVEPVAEDRSKWLFVIGIENYKTTDDILFSRRSAELFKQVAMKTLGIRERQAYVLLDDDATSASIQDKLRFMLRNVKAGDKIYFYYSGHGIPAPNKDNAAYILAADKSPDFVADNDFFAVDTIYKTLTDSPASQVIAFMDSCFTGQTDGKSVFGGTKAATSLAPKRSQFDTTKMAVITAGTDRQFSNALQGRGHRLFSYYLMQSMLKGRSDIASLYKEVSLNVEDASRELGDINLQQPVLTGNADLAL